MKPALKSSLFLDIIVFTATEEISDIAIKEGVKMPFLRSEKNSNYYSCLIGVLEDVIKNSKEIGSQFQYLCCIFFPTAPFVTVKSLLKSYKLLINKKFTTVFSIVKLSYSIQRSLNMVLNKVEMLWLENFQNVLRI